LLDERAEVERVIARSEFGDDAAIGAVKFDLAGDFRGEDLGGFARRADKDGDGGFVAGRFDGEKEHGGMK
jgi:hypothetical protein